MAPAFASARGFRAAREGEPGRLHREWTDDATKRVLARCREMREAEYPHLVV